jgi:putative transposase
VKYACIARHREEFEVRLMCRLLAVSSSGFYAAQRRAPSARVMRDQVLRLHVRTAHEQSARIRGIRVPPLNLDAQMPFCTLYSVF